MNRTHGYVHSEAELAFAFSDDKPAYLGMYTFTVLDP